jgi:hypothetical protein
MWIYVPSQHLASAPAEGVLSSDSTLPCEDTVKKLSQSATWNGKPTRPQSWRREWKKEHSPLHRFGPTQKHSQTDLESICVARWNSLPEVIRVSPSAGPGNAREPMTLGTFGRIYAESSPQSDLFGPSSKTSRDTSPSVSTRWSEAFTTWVTLLRQDYLARRRWAQATGGSGCSSSRSPWRTPNGTDGEGGVMEMREGKDGHYKLRDHAVHAAKEMESAWPTPRGSEHKGTGPVGSKSHQHRLDRFYLDAHASHFSLQGQQTEKPGNVSSQNGPTSHRQWVTPRGRDYKGASKAERVTPEGRMSADGKQRFGLNLAEQAQLSTDKKMLNDPCPECGEIREAQVTYPAQTSHQQWPTASCTTTGGPTGLAGGTGNRKKMREIMGEEMNAKLNPKFVEWLMGLPEGWSSPYERTDFASWETGFYPHVRRLLTQYSEAGFLE